VTSFGLGSYDTSRFLHCDNPTTVVPGYRSDRGTSLGRLDEVLASGDSIQTTGLVAKALRRVYRADNPSNL